MFGCIMEGLQVLVRGCCLLVLANIYRLLSSAVQALLLLKELAESNRNC